VERSVAHGIDVRVPLAVTLDIVMGVEDHTRQERAVHKYDRDLSCYIAVLKGFEKAVTKSAQTCLAALIRLGVTES
jgi:hypothetical protein